MRLKTLSVFCLFLFLLAISPASANGFESGLVGWSPSTDYSDTASASAQGFVNIYTADAYAGTKSVQVTAYAKNSQYYTMVLELGSGVDLTNINTLSFWQKTFDILNPSGTAKGFVCIDDTQVWTMSSGANYASWTNTSIDVSGYTGTHSIQFKCTAISTGEEEKYSWLLDNVAIDGHLVPVGTASRNFYVSDSSTGTAISGATVTVTASEEGSLTTAANGYTTHFTALVSTHTYSYTITKSGYATKTGTFTTGWEDSGTVYVTMTAEATPTPTPTPGTLQISSYSPTYSGAENYNHIKITTTDTNHDGGQTSGTWTVPAGVTSVDVLVVAGGGAGGSGGGGGGGAGGLITSYDVTVLSGSSISLSIGHGGTGASASSGTNGGNSIFSSLTAIGGGGGSKPISNGADGGSGGGAGHMSGIYYGGSGISGQGFNGGNNLPVSPYPTGGGGGAGSAGINGSESQSGNGGTGLTIWGTNYAGGGGGGGTNYGSSRGTGSYGGGNGGISDAKDGVSGIDNTGGGGGGGYGGADDVSSVGGYGGNGVIIIRYAIATLTPTPTPTATAATPTPLPTITIPKYEITSHHEAAEVTLAESYNLMPAMYMLIILLFLGAVLGRK